MRVVSAVLLVLSTGPVLAADGAAELAGRATLGAEERPVTLRLACDPAAGLSAALTVPRFEALSETFDFDAFEGPTGTGAPLTAIQVSSPDGVRSVRTSAGGATAVDPATSFTLTVAGTGRRQDPLRGIGPALTEAGARITWTQSSPRKGDAPLVATFSVVEAAPLKAALGPCLGR